MPNEPKEPKQVVPKRVQRAVDRGQRRRELEPVPQGLVPEPVPQESVTQEPVVSPGLRVAKALGPLLLYLGWEGAEREQKAKERGEESFITDNALKASLNELVRSLRRDPRYPFHKNKTETKKFIEKCRNLEASFAEIVMAVYGGPFSTGGYENLRVKKRYVFFKALRTFDAELQGAKLPVKLASMLNEFREHIGHRLENVRNKYRDALNSGSAVPPSIKVLNNFILETERLKLENETENKKLENERRIAASEQEEKKLVEELTEAVVDSVTKVIAHSIPLWPAGSVSRTFHLPKNASPEEIPQIMRRADAAAVAGRNVQFVKLPSVSKLADEPLVEIEEGSGAEVQIPVFGGTQTVFKPDPGISATPAAGPAGASKSAVADEEQQAETKRERDKFDVMGQGLANVQASIARIQVELEKSSRANAEVAARVGKTLQIMQEEEEDKKRNLKREPAAQRHGEGAAGAASQAALTSPVNEAELGRRVLDQLEKGDSVLRRHEELLRELLRSSEVFAAYNITNSQALEIFEEYREHHQEELRELREREKKIAVERNADRNTIVRLESELKSFREETQLFHTEERLFHQNVVNAETVMLGLVHEVQEDARRSHQNLVDLAGRNRALEEQMSDLRSAEVQHRSQVGAMTGLIRGLEDRVGGLEGTLREEHELRGAEQQAHQRNIERLERENAERNRALESRFESMQTAEEQHRQSDRTAMENMMSRFGDRFDRLDGELQEERKLRVAEQQTHQETIARLERELIAVREQNQRHHDDTTHALEQERRRVDLAIRTETDARAHGESAGHDALARAILDEQRARSAAIGVERKERADEIAGLRRALVAPPVVAAAVATVSGPQPDVAALRDQLKTVTEELQQTRQQLQGTQQQLQRDEQQMLQYKVGVKKAIRAAASITGANPLVTPNELKSKGDSAFDKFGL